ncbi:hypothetical protein [Nonomuraea sp. NPDC050691]|uniref:hypothetical protein n=1 Tax=Nonomuraea sp. NPDC050691 TaxID=3155661 RepID=UPI00340F18C7
MKIRLVTCASVAALGVGAGMVTAVPAPEETRVVPAGGTSPLAGFDPAKLKSALDGVHGAGMPGVYAEVRDAGQVWRVASRIPPAQRTESR